MQINDNENMQHMTLTRIEIWESEQAYGTLFTVKLIGDIFDQENEIISTQNFIDEKQAGDWAANAALMNGLKTITHKF